MFTFTAKYTARYLMAIQYIQHGLIHALTLLVKCQYITC